jgi:hypothetical protein
MTTRIVANSCNKECCNPSLGSRPRQGGCKGASQREAQEVSQREARELSQKEARELSQREARELSQKEARELSQREARELSQKEAQELKQEEARESHHIFPRVQESARACEGVNTHTPKATPTWGDGVSVDSRNFRERLQGSNFNGLWRSLYHWKSLEA